DTVSQQDISSRDTVSQDPEDPEDIRAVSSSKADISKAITSLIPLLKPYLCNRRSPRKDAVAILDAAVRAVVP
ncbi:hypothetical protein GGH20_001824, partial [Coemansia sp. RSA 1937]